MENEVVKQDTNLNQNSRVWTGIFLLIIGSILFASKMGVPIPDWLMSWEVFVMALGLLIGIRHKFRNPAWIILIFVGGASFVDNFYPDLKIRNFIWPAAIILLGLFFILRPNKLTRKSWLTGKKDDPYKEQYQSGFQPIYNETTSSEEVLDITAVFGGVKKRLISKNFRGGDITAFMGGAEIDLTGADIQNTAVLDVSAVFGGIKLIVPADWRVQNKATAVFGGVEDKRMMPATLSNKLLIIDGAAVFGGIELKSY